MKNEVEANSPVKLHIYVLFIEVILCKPFKKD